MCSFYECCEYRPHISWVSSAMWDIRIKESVHLNSADVVLVIPMIPPPFFPVPFIHSLAWSGYAWLNSLQHNCLFWTLIKRVLEADAHRTPPCVSGRVMWSAAILFMLIWWSTIKTQLGMRASRINHTLFMLRRMSALSQPESGQHCDVGSHFV